MSHRRSPRLVLVACLAAFAGCGAGSRNSRTEIGYVFPYLMFVSPKADGEFSAFEFSDGPDTRLTTPFHLRLDGRTVLSVRDLDRETAAKHFEPVWPPGDPRPEADRDPKSADVFVRNRDGFAATTVRFEPGGLVRLESGGAVHLWSHTPSETPPDPGVEISRDAAGPFVRLPLSRRQVLDAFGKPHDESTYRNDRPFAT